MIKVQRSKCLRQFAMIWAYIILVMLRTCYKVVLSEPYGKEGAGVGETQDRMSHND